MKVKCPTAKDYEDGLIVSIAPVSDLSVRARIRKCSISSRYKED
jgi:hypothetical protein